MLIDRKLKPEQQFAGACFGGITVILSKFCLKISRAHVVVVGGISVCINRIALAHRLPHLGVAHQHHVKYAQVFKGELILSQLT